MKRALVIGVDDYGGADNDLEGCVADAIAVTEKLQTHGNGDPNFDVITYTSNDMDVTTELLDEGVKKLFQGKAETAVLYFAGHGLLEPETNRGYLVSHDHKKGALGLSLADVIGMANGAHQEIDSTVIILDCCHAGFLGELSGLANKDVSLIGKGVTILAAADRNQSAAEFDGHGLFTGIVLDGLSGSASDVLGRITPASLYSLVDQTLGGWEQRPVYKANVQRFITLRQVPPKVAPEVLRKLKDYFPTAGYVFPVDPSFERDRGEFADAYKDIPVDEINFAIFREMQAFYKVNLVAPVDQPYPWQAAMHSTGFRLTAQGAHYRRLAENKRF
ncbi:caspase family protein [Mesorhizobium sp. M0571]|uniref:caspase family protein n=1 Tax=Mesorhizobium sp. M0571 TaxID=2956960 RepID=UPI003337EAE3